MSRIGRVNQSPYPIITGTGGMGGVSIPPETIPPIALDDLTDVDTAGVMDGDVLTFEYGLWVPGPNSVVTTMWVPVMTEDVTSGLWYVAVTGDGDAVMTEVPL